MNIDLRGVPFSRNGAYLAFSLLASARRRAGADWPEGLYMRSVHGGAVQAQPGGRLASIEPLLPAGPLGYSAQASPARLDLHTERGRLSFAMPEPWVLRVRGEGVGLRMTFDVTRGDMLISGPDGRWRINIPALQVQYLLTPLAGAARVEAGADGWLTLDLLPADSANGVCEAALEETNSAWRPRAYEETFEECVRFSEGEFQQWHDQTASVPEPYREARRMAAYVTWSSLVEPVGHYLRPAMLMSKNWMTNVWAWDHCFNAMALVYRKPIAAWDQLMNLFDQQDELGGLPDYVNDREMLWNFCKPPIHGWALGWMMDHTPFVRSDQVRQIYGPLCRWTEWWLRYRDDDEDGLPQYHHGNDSGWDNATPFEAGVPLESPDLCAFLILQMETLVRLAEILNNTEEAESWQRRSEELLEKMLAHFWQGDHFVAMRSGDHLVGDTESLLLYLPLILGRRLPAGVRSDLIAGLTRPGRFLTSHGLATESPRSSAYQADGYWRGPIWAPSTLLMVEGLAGCGEWELARDVARRFCDMAARSGFAENFDAQTGAPLRDRAYTWTASVFLILAHEYLMNR
jgi:glycogen debranching enzyme